MLEDNMVLQRTELTDLSLLIANMVYDLYFTQCYVGINKMREKDSVELKPLSVDDMDNVFADTMNLLKDFSATSALKNEREKVMDLYNKILRDNRGLLLTESNIKDMVALAIANCDMPLDIGPCIVHFNSFIDEETDDMKKNLDELINQFDKVYIEKDLKEFIWLCNETKPLLDKYVINELEVCDLLKPLGMIEDKRVYYLNIESKPTPPFGYSAEFTYPLIPYRVIGYIDNIGNIKPNNTNSEIHVSVLIQDMNIYEYTNTEEYIDIKISLRDNKYFQEPSQDNILIERGIRISFKDYLKLYMVQDVTIFLQQMLSLLDVNGLKEE